MAKIVVRKFRELDELDLFLGGAILGADVSFWASSVRVGVGGAKEVPALAGLALTFTAPAGTVTFAPGADTNGRLTYLEIKAQVEAAIPALLVRQFEGRLVFVEATPSTGVTLAASASGGFARVVGSVDLSTLAYGAGGTLDGETIVFKHNGGANLSVTFVAPGNEHDVITQINAVTLTDITASLVPGSDHLQLETPDEGAGVSITVNAGGTATTNLGLVAGTYDAPTTNGANAALGFDTQVASSGKVYGSPYAATPPTPPYFLQAYSTNDNMHVLYTFE